MRRGAPAVLGIGLAGLLAAAPAWAVREFVDGVGRKVAVPDKPRAIVSLAPNITEMLFAVGAGAQVAGVTDFCNYPEEAYHRPRVGGFVNPSLEVIAALLPDLIIATADGNRPADVLRLEKMGLPVYVTETRTLNEIGQTIGVIGKLTGREAKAEELAASLAKRRADIAARVGGLPKPRVLFLVGWKPMVGVGPGTFLDNLIEEAGGENVLSSVQVRYPIVGFENLLAADPDVIIINLMGGEPAEGTPVDINGWDRLRAVRQRRLYDLRDDALMRPGPRIMDGLEHLAGYLHPDLPAPAAPP